MSNLSDTLSRVALLDELSKPTAMKTVAPLVQEVVQNRTDFTGFENGDIEEPEKIDHAQQKKPEPEPVEPEEPYDAETEATKLLGMLNAGNQIICAPIASWKLKKNRGGKKVLERMKTAWHKRGAKIKCTEQELDLALSYESYLADTKQLSGEILFTEMEMENLKKLAIPYCESTKIKINSGAAFWSTYGGLQITKVMKILTS